MNNVVTIMKEVFVKKIIVIVALLVINVVIKQAFAKEALCQESHNDCTFVLLSQTGREEVTEVIKASETFNDKVTQTSTYSENSEIMLIVNAARANLALSPFSTFKIPNTLIALDSGQIPNTVDKLSYDKNKYPMQAWWPSSWTNVEHNMTTAFKASVVPIYRQIATEIGEENMQLYIDDFAYGNQDISSGLDHFWLNGSLKISAIEQVRFLQKMYRGQIPVSPQSLDQLKEIMLVEENENYSLYAKTGTGKTKLHSNEEGESILGWYVGFVENKKGVHFFAFNLTRSSYAKINAERIHTVRHHLKKAGVI